MKSKKYSKDLGEILSRSNDFRLLSPQARGVSPKYFHLFSNKIIDGEKRNSKLGKYFVFNFILNMYN